MKRPKTRLLVALSTLMLLGVPMAFAQSDDDVKPTSNQPSPPVNAESKDSQNENSTNSERGQPRDEEAPITTSSQARPSLDYEPSESISEDRSVSFPVDI